MRIVLLRAGRIGRLHARVLAATPGVSALLVADVDAQRAAEVAETVGARAVPTIEAALDHADALVITAATDAHPALIRAGADRRLPVFCEKPIVGPDGAMAIVDGRSRPGDYVDLLAEMDVLAAVSNCPQIHNPCNAGRPTRIRLVIYEAPVTSRPSAGRVG